jgi:hypothetical protein
MWAQLELGKVAAPRGEQAGPPPPTPDSTSPPATGEPSVLTSLLYWLSLLLYVISFALPVDRGLLGFTTFWFGLIAFFKLPYSLPWYGNILFALAVRSFVSGKYRAAFWRATAAALLACLLLVMVDEFPSGPAYYCWAGSMGLLAVAAIAEVTAGAGFDR